MGRWCVLFAGGMSVVPVTKHMGWKPMLRKPTGGRHMLRRAASPSKRLEAASTFTGGTSVLLSDVTRSAGFCRA
jgi:hypothetical protein